MRALHIFASSLALLGAVACGGEEPGLRVAFQMSAANCLPERAALIQARLRVPGVDGYCYLDRAADNTVSGLCYPVPTGEQVVVGLEYGYFMTNNEWFPLAQAAKAVDLTDASDETVNIDFTTSELRTQDTDSDGLSDISEFCSGRDPMVFGS